MLGLAGAPDRADDGGHRAKQAARRGDEAAAREHVGRIGVELEPPDEEAPGPENGHAEERRPAMAELGLVAERG